MFAGSNFAKLYMVVKKGFVSIIIKKVAHVSLIWHTIISHTQTFGHTAWCLS